MLPDINVMADEFEPQKIHKNAVKMLSKIGLNVLGYPLDVPAPLQIITQYYIN